MNKKLKNFTYSQNSLNTYKVCPTKFKYKYIDNINLNIGEVENRDYYESLKLGRDFHLVCERYFRKIPTGLSSGNEKFERWIKKIKKVVPIKDENIYLPEYEVRLRLGENNIQAKYDLVVIGKNTISIWDWKTEAKKIEQRNLENRMQTIVYMFLAKEVIPKLLDVEVDYKNIKMNYYQPEFYVDPITINYSEEKHNINKNKILSLMDIVQRTVFEEEDYKDICENTIDLIKNKDNCKFCEFNKLCNGQEVDYKNLEDEVYGT